VRLKSIKLSGFKSFVDPTTVLFPTDMTCVVGPNGCGKSNVIDAIKWVMGESSAKQLRGESMTDVIFKGSSSRKPSSYAHVELIFDNTSGRIIGEYAAYNELSIKRKLTSDSQNTYYLNGNKCRRKDIMDIFLGTGLGPRSYAVISQGIISNLVESKPDELRGFIEEAAGISRYKERRKETEARLRRARENLARLSDLREELNRRLSHLKRQAETAEKYRKIREEERLKRAELYALKWLSLDRGAKTQEAAIHEFEVVLEGEVAKQRSSDSHVEKLRQNKLQLTDIFEETQKNYYTTGSNITRLEQIITHSLERAVQIERDLKESKLAIHENQENLEKDHYDLEQLEEQKLDLIPDLEKANEDAEMYSVELEEAESLMMEWQDKWEEFNENSAKYQRSAEIEQSKIKHQEITLERLEIRLNKYKDELHSLQAGPVEEEIELLTEELLELQELIEIDQIKHDENGIVIEQTREKINDLNQDKSDCNRKLNEFHGKKVSLDALQQAALGHTDNSVKWLSNQELKDNTNLAQAVIVREGWDKAVETVLGNYLQAICIDDLNIISEAIPLIEEMDISFVLPSSNLKTGSISNQKATLLSTYVEESNFVSDLLKGVYTASGLEEALRIKSQIEIGESVITIDGIWMGSNWLKVTRDIDDTNSGIIARTQEIKNLDASLSLCISQEDVITETLIEENLRLKKTEKEKEKNHIQISELLRKEIELQSNLHSRKAKIEQVLSRHNQLKEEIIDLEAQQESEYQTMKDSRVNLQTSLDNMEKSSESRIIMMSDRDIIRTKLDSVRKRSDDSKKIAHQLELQNQGIIAKITSTQQALTRLTIQIEKSNDRLVQLQESLLVNDDPIEEQKIELEDLLAQRLTFEQKMREEKEKVESVETEMQQFELLRHEAEKDAQGVRDKLEKLRIDLQGVEVRRSTLHDQLADDEFHLETVLSNLPEAATNVEWEQKLDKISAQIKNLGAINLAAIEEYEQQSKRKLYLDSQNDDLFEAITTLEGAISKIDSETRLRFQNTFEKVNCGLKDLFPQFFGGGNAYLELTGSDLLDTGVTIMAQPPGKKNSTIYLLSGGEKALTAISLVFAIFRLNPAPFCILDEVDAPLDDANVVRYAKMVSAMSEKLQFIYISHNKIAMEAAKQLVGVTMHEPGVSRPVSVDIEKAAALATH